jgi:predicted phosphate transport protein (TIGR00153 family)
MKFFLPKEPAFLAHFKDMSVCLCEITSIFKDFTSNFKDFPSYWQRAKEIEHKADAKTHQIISLLNQSFITPFDREDIYQLVHELDDIIDLLEHSIHNIYLFEMSEKKEFLDEFAKLIGSAADALNALLSECFEHQKYTDSIWKLILEIHDLEDEGDLAYEKALRTLFSEEHDPIKIIKWKDILETLEFIMDVFQKVSNTIEGVVVKSG